MVLEFYINSPYKIVVEDGFWVGSINEIFLKFYYA